MPITNYCKRCKAETPAGELCPRCGAKLTRAGERLAFEVTRTPATDWFCWNAMLRVVVPVIGLVLLATVAIEAAAEGARGVVAVFSQGFFWTLLLALGALLLMTLALLALQGPERVRYQLDAKGAHAAVYVRAGRPLALYARLTTPETAQALQAEAPEHLPEGWLYLRSTHVAWPAVRRARTWPETRTLLLYAPAFWLALAIRCDAATFAEAEAYIQKKAPKKKKTARKGNGRKK